MDSSVLPLTKGDILIVDDMPDNLRLLSTLLLRNQYQVRNAINGQLALRAIQLKPPDLILLDIKMPKMDGFEVCQRLKENQSTQEIPIIFISALDALPERIRGLTMGGVDYITKPFHVEEVLVRIQNQLALRQLRQQLQSINADLERQVQAQTDELRLALHYETTLKSITDRVRNSLDEHQILQEALQHLASALKVSRCLAGFYDVEHTVYRICYEHRQTESSVLGRTLQPELLADIHQPQTDEAISQFCPTVPLAIYPDSDALTILACPIADEHGVSGDLWLFKPAEDVFDELDIRLISQVANQCAIALRQSRLYHSAQEQVQELERLNQLKDNFLNTISHELRTPMANIKMTIEMLEVVLRPLKVFDSADSSVSRYFQILKQECEREISLINDLLDLVQLESGMDPLMLSTLPFGDWLAHVGEALSDRAHERQQSLQLDIPDDLPDLSTDYYMLESVIKELLTNACKYSPRGAVIGLSAAAGDATIQIFVSNSGVSIPASEFPNIFQKFYRILSDDPWSQPGTGLGLALVQKRVERLQGNIHVTSDEAMTTFVVTLPLALDSSGP